MTNVTETRKILITLMLGLIALGVCFLTYFLWDYYRYSSLPKLSAANLGITEEKQLREIQPKVYYVGQEAELQKVGTVYLGSKSVKLDQEKAISIASKFNFAPSLNKVGDSFAWEDASQKLFVNLKDQDIDFFSSTLVESVSSKNDLPTKNDLELEAKDIMDKIDIPEAVVDFKKGIISYSSQIGTEGAAVKANITVADFPLTKDDVPIYDSSDNTLNLQIKLGVGGKLVSFHAPWQPYSWSKLGSYPLKSISASVKEIEKGGGVITQLTASQIGNKTQENKNIIVINLTDVKLGYLPVISQETYLLPIHIFSGRAVLKSGEVCDITIYNSALAKRFITK